MNNNLLKKAYYNLLCDKYILSLKKIDLISRVKYIKDKYIGILKNDRDISFCNKKYYFDNRFGSVIYQLFPIEIEKISNVIDFNLINSVLDIGSNTGQWSFALKCYFPDIKIYSFEPIAMAFESLRKNSLQFENWQVFNYAIGNEEGEKDFYYSPEGTTTGSFYKENICPNFKRKEIKEEKVKVIKIQKNNLNIPLFYDFIKVDVEGFEKEVIKSLGDMNFRYLYIEIFKDNKTFEEAIADITNILKAQGKECIIIYKNYLEISSEVIEVIMKNTAVV